MKSPVIKIILLSIFSLLSIHTDKAFGWHDETHLAVAKAAGYYKWFNAAAPDIVKIKAGSIERYNHFFNNPSGLEITPAFVLKQTKKYNNPRDQKGHLYGAVIASLREYETALKQGRYAEYHLAFCAHYIADLSSPLHNVPYDDFNRMRHLENDGKINNEALKNIEKIKKHMYRIYLRPDHFEFDLAKEIARIATESGELGQKLRNENRSMTKKEAYMQLGQSASLLKAILGHLGKTNAF